MPTYGQFCPVAMTSEVLTQRWTPLVVRELLAGSRRFNDLRRGVPLMSPSLLSQRLKSLERVGVVERRRDPDGQAVEYHLTLAGQELGPIIESMGTWGQRWARGDLNSRHMDASLLMWDIRRNIHVDKLPASRVVAHFHLRGSSDKKSRFWLVLEPEVVDLCLVDPGYEVDVFISAHMRTMVDYW
ncbi:MAG: winged helix-turn-helix transcriptional regulator, partial [Acidimicrobiia bacterium]